MLLLLVRFSENSILSIFLLVVYSSHSRSNKPRNDLWLMTEYTVFWIKLSKRLIQFVNFYE